MLNWHASILILTITQSTVCQPWELNGTCWDGGEEMFCHRWLPSPFSCSAFWDMESGQLTVTTDVMSLPPPCTWSWLQALHVQSLRSLTQGEHLSKTCESNLPKCVVTVPNVMEVCVGVTYWCQSWLAAVLPLPSVPCVGEVIGVWVCFSLVSRRSKENREEQCMSGSLEFSGELGNYCTWC